MPPCLKLQTLKTVLNEFPQKPNKATYVPRARDNLVVTGEARMALPVCYMENVRSHRRRDAQSEIASGIIDVVQQLGYIGSRQRGGAAWVRGCFPASG